MEAISGPGRGCVRHCVVRGCNIFDNGNTGLGMGQSEDCQVVGCTLLWNNYRRFPAGWHSGA